MMNILIYIEPHPVRSSMTHFTAIAREFSAVLGADSGSDVRLFANKETINEVLKAAPLSRPYLVSPTERENQRFKEHLGVWAEESIATWVSLMSGEGLVESYTALLDRIHSEFPFDVIVHWGENGTITKFCADRRLMHVAIEMGCTRPPYMNSVILDVLGTNGAAIVPRLSIEDLRDVVGGEGMSAEEATCGFSATGTTSSSEEPYGKVPMRIRDALSLGDRKIAYLPLQLHDDANLLKFSKYDTLRDVVLDCVPQLVEAGYLVLIKPHPGAPHRPYAEIENEIARESLRPWKQNIIWCADGRDTYNNLRLVALADVVVTVNSSVGFEALYQNKPVVVLGEAVYAPRGLFPSLDEFLSGRFDVCAYYQAVGWLRRFFFAAYLNQRRDLFSRPWFLKRITMLAKGFETCGTKPKDLARFYMESFSSADANPDYAEYATHFRPSDLTRFELFEPRRFPELTGSDFVKLLSQRFAELGVDADTSFTPPPYPTDSRPLAFYYRLCNRLRSLNGRKFSDWLRTGWSSPLGREAVIDLLGVFDAEAYLRDNSDVRESGMLAITHFAKFGIKEGRKFNSSFPAKTEEEFLTDLTQAVGADLGTIARPIANRHSLRHYPFASEERGRLFAARDALSADLPGPRPRLAVMLYLQAVCDLEYIWNKLDAIDEPFDVIAVIPDWENADIKSEVLRRHSAATFSELPARGRDIGAFMHLLPVLQEKQYELVAVLSDVSPREFHVGDTGDTSWLTAPNKNLFREVIAAFTAEPKLNLIGGEASLRPFRNFPYSDVGKLAGSTIGRTDFSIRHGLFFADPNIWVRLKCLKPLTIAHPDLDITCFGGWMDKTDRSLEFNVRRLISHLAVENGGTIKGMGATST